MGNPTSESEKGKSGTGNRGFAGMDEQKQRDVSSEGGRNAQETGQDLHSPGRKGVDSGNDRQRMSDPGINDGRSGNGGRSTEGTSSTQRGGSSDQHSKAGSQNKL